jgi:hypothetical protein
MVEMTVSATGHFARGTGVMKIAAGEATQGIN